MERQPVLEALYELVVATRPELVVQAGAPNEGIARLLVDATRDMGIPVHVATRPAGNEDTRVIEGSGGERPSVAVASALGGKRAFVHVVGMRLADVFSLAALVRPGSTFVLQAPEGDISAFARLGCSRALDVEARLTDAAVLRKRDLPTPAPAGFPPRRRRPRRPLRSVFLGDVSYNSAYRFGVEQGMTLLGHWHRTVSIRDEPSALERQVREMRPDLVFTHMLLWPPRGATPVPTLLEMSSRWRKDGAIVLVHDGDPRPAARFPYDVSDAVDAALLNHARPTAAWGVPTHRWPYAAFTQERIGDPVGELRCELAFAGLMRHDGDLYERRTATIEALRGRLDLRVFPGPDGVNNRMQIADVAASALAVLGFGRPEVPGWIDTRVFSVPGAGGVLIHDDAERVLEPWTHFVPCRRFDVDSILAGVKHAKRFGDAIRAAAFEHVQAHHTWRHRCAEVIDLLYRPE